MGFLSDFLGGGAAKASKTAGAIQAGAVDDAVDRVNTGTEDAQRFLASAEGDVRFAQGQAEQNLGFFRDTGRSALGGAQDLVSDPNAQRDFIQNNPFFNSLADNAQQRLLGNQAAKGKVGSGGTAEALQNSILLLGNDLVSQNVGQRMGIANLGFNAAQSIAGSNFDAAGQIMNLRGRQAGTEVDAGRTIAELFTQKGNASASGVVGAANARSQGAQNAVGTALGIGKLFLSDRRHKREITKIGEARGLNVYRFRYAGTDAVSVGVMAQEAAELYPSAVHEIDGVLFVDYGAIF